MPHLYVDISAHGYGHLAQTAPVLAAWRARFPATRLSIASALPRAQLAQRIAEPFEHLATASDFGFVMHNAIDIDIAASAERYRTAHADWPARVQALATQLTALQPDLVLANAAYLPLAASAAAGIPAAGMSSLNWADLFADVFADVLTEPDNWATPIHARMLAAYNAADLFLRLTPGLPMPALTRRHDIAPVARSVGAPRADARTRLATALDVPLHARWMLVAMGGIAFRLPVERWPRRADIVWLCPAAWGVTRADMRAFDGAGAPPFTDVLNACDAVLTKPGYGTFVEAACLGVPVLYVPRSHWAEQGPLVDWLQRHARAQAVERQRALAGDFLADLDALWARTPPPPPVANGAAEAVTQLSALLRR